MGVELFFDKINTLQLFGLSPSLSAMAGQNGETSRFGVNNEV